MEADQAGISCGLAGRIRDEGGGVAGRMFCCILGCSFMVVKVLWEVTLTNN